MKTKVAKKTYEVLKVMGGENGRTVSVVDEKGIPGASLLGWR